MLRTIYLHGFASGPSSKKARYFADRFAARGRDIEVPDLAEGDFQNLTITGQLRVIERVARGEPLDLIGSSLGGYLAALYAKEHAEVRKLVLLAPALGFARRWTQDLGRNCIEGWKTSGVLPVFHYGENRECLLGWNFYEDALRYEDEPDFSQPAMIFHGSADTVVPASASIGFAREHDNVALHIVDAGHELLEALDLIFEEAAGFLEG